MKTSQQLENELREVRMQEHQERMKLRKKKEEEFRALNNINAYTAGDYAGLVAGETSFYYGYEETMCEAHKNEDCSEDCEKSEWCFIAQRDGEELLKIPTSKLWFEQGNEPVFYLLVGIGMFVKHVNGK